MRLAVITDIHGNIHALEAVLGDIKAQSVDLIVVAGDTVNILPHSKACWDRVTELGCPVLKGNHEYYLHTFGTSSAPLEWTQERWQGLAWLRQQFSDVDMFTMRALPVTYELPDLLVTHASPRSLFDNVKVDTSTEKLTEMFADFNSTLIIRGHNHAWYETYWDNKTLMTVASCGLPFGGSLGAQYLLLEKRERWYYEKRYVSYHREAALASMDSAYLEHYGPMGKLFKHDLLTGRNHTLPFLAQYLNPIENGEITLTHAVERFLS